MTYVVFDAATGLPKLPEGYWWDIQQDAIYICRYNEWSKWSPIEMYRKSWGKVTREERTVEVTTGRPFNRITTQKEYRYRNWEIVHLKRYGEKSGYTIVFSTDPVTRENILERTTEIYNEWQKAIESAKLYGKYPPKKFE